MSKRAAPEFNSARKQQRGNGAGGGGKGYTADVAPWSSTPTPSRAPLGSQGPTFANPPALILRMVASYLPYADLLAYARVNRCWSHILRQHFWGGRSLRFAGNSLARFESFLCLLQDSAEIWPEAERIGAFCRVLWLECVPTIVYKNVTIPEPSFREVMELLPNLRVVWMMCFLTDAMLTSIADSCRDLRILFLQRLSEANYGMSAITEDGMLRFLARAVNLERLFLSFAFFHCEDGVSRNGEVSVPTRRQSLVTPLLKNSTTTPKFAALTKLFLSHLQISMSQALIESAPNVTELRFILSTELNEFQSAEANQAVLQSIATGFSKLETFCLLRVQSPSVAWIDSAAWFPQLLMNNPKLSTLAITADLHIGSNTRFDLSVASLSDRALALAAPYISGLRCLRLHHHPQVTDSGVRVLADSARGLECLWLEQAGVTDACFEWLEPGRLTRLRHLTVGTFQYPENGTQIPVRPGAVWELLGRFERVSFTGHPFPKPASSISSSITSAAAGDADELYTTFLALDPDGTTYQYVQRGPTDADGVGALTETRRITHPPCSRCRVVKHVAGNQYHELWYWQEAIWPEIMKVIRYKRRGSAPQWSS